jgi:hypothetical protein
MLRSATLEDFLSRTASHGDYIGEDAPPVAPPTPIPGMQPGDPMRPWRDLDVSSYVPLAEWLIAKPFDIAAVRFGKNEDERDLLRLDEEDREVLRPAVTEATQKCLYDLKLSALLKNPYVALGGALAIATAAKVTAIQLLRKREKEEAAGQRNGERQRARESARSTSEGMGPGMTTDQGGPIQPQTLDPRRNQPRGRAVQPLPFTPRASSTMSTKAVESVAEFSLSDSPEAVNLSSLYDELEDAAGL